jgi:N-glycosylase/DNA lyase
MTQVWKPIGKQDIISLTGIVETLLGGQSFAWTSLSNHRWRGVIYRSVIELQWKKRQLSWSQTGGTPLNESTLLDYLWLDDSYIAAIDALPWRSDYILNRAIQKFSGLRILRQPIEEVLMVFLLSSAKSIPQIKELRTKIHRLLGNDLGGGNYAFPGWDRLASLSEEKARSLGMGYRAKYLVGTARFLQQRPEWLDELKQLSYNQAKMTLMELPGVGPKIADCVLLFGGGKTEAFPIDTWIFQSLQKQYRLEGWKVAQMQDFAQIHFGQHAGLAQQFLFSLERTEARKSLPQK